MECPMITLDGGLRIAVIGLGYVGLPLAAKIARLYDTVGFDIDAARVSELNSGFDRTREVEERDLSASNLRFSSQPHDIVKCDIFIVCVPTPVDAVNRPDLRALKAASRLVGRCLSPGGIVIYESTVYPGCTEEECVPILEKASDLTFNVDFFCGYSPERTNPGDKDHHLGNVIKVTSGSTSEAAQIIDKLYRAINPAGTHLAKSIKVAEAAKVIENTQRDINIAIMNEFALIFGRLNLDTSDVLEAAATKWNFLRFQPGLVGGHCIGVDPFYLAHKAQEVGLHPSIILAARRVNDGMGCYVAQRVLKLMVKNEINTVGSRALVLGFAFKENCPDIRNSMVVDIVNELSDFGVRVDVHDPWADIDHAASEYGVKLKPIPDAHAYDAIVFAVAHACFVDNAQQAITSWAKEVSVVFDVKSVIERKLVDGRL
jgi:UDP-N-acetyl-D-galactosamine dehydrogenase